MPGLAATETVDVVAQDGDGQYVLIMVETRPWGADPAQAAQLRAKMNSYVGYILDGGLVRRYPETAGKRLRIQLDCAEPPVGEIEVVTNHAAKQLERLGIDFRVNVQGPLPEV